MYTFLIRSRVIRSCRALWLLFYRPQLSSGRFRPILALFLLSMAVEKWRKVEGVAVSCCSNFCQHFCFHSMSWPDSSPTFSTISISKRNSPPASFPFHGPKNSSPYHFWILFWIETRRGPQQLCTKIDDK